MVLVVDLVRSRSLWLVLVVVIGCSGWSRWWFYVVQGCSCGGSRLF